MRLRTAVLGTAFAVAFAGAAEARQIDGWYISLEAGANWIEDWNHQRFGSATPRVATFDTGWAVLTSAGYGWRNWRFEFEAGYRNNDADTYQIGAGAPFAVNADVWEASFMANALYDIAVTGNVSLSLGAGLGGDFANGQFTLGGASLEADDWNFAYQGIAGLNYDLGRRTSLFLNYRYMRITDLEFDFRPASAVFLTNGDDMVKHTATIGLRYAFASPVMADVAPPPPAPATPMGAPQQFIVFFGFNKYNLTSEALRVISEAVSAAKLTGSATVLITGHTDTVGSHSYNQRLSMRRSNVVKAEMVRQGIAPGQISSNGKGETELLVQTADGVKEPQNRRATIDLN